MTVEFHCDDTRHNTVTASLKQGDTRFFVNTGLTLTDLCLSDELNIAALHRAVRKHLPALRALAAASGEMAE